LKNSDVADKVSAVKRQVKLLAFRAGLPGKEQSCFYCVPFHSPQAEAERVTLPVIGEKEDGACLTGIMEKF
jgi:hypothetical protein